jgi:hypothetical protein
VDISHTWCKRGEWGNENANEKRLSQNHEEQKQKPQCSVVLQKKNHKWATEAKEWPTHSSPTKKYTKKNYYKSKSIGFCMSRNEENFISNKYFTNKKTPKILNIASRKIILRKFMKPL